MYGTVFALIIALVMIGFVIYKGSVCGGICYVCKKSEIEYLMDSLPDDCIIEIWIGRKTYDEFGNRNYSGRNLRNHISE